MEREPKIKIGEVKTEKGVDPNINTFEHVRSGVEAGAAMYSQEKRPNLEALEAQRDKYIREAIREVEKTIPKAKFNEQNIGFISSDVLGVLEKKHGANLSSVISPSLPGTKSMEEQKALDQADEVLDTYPEERIADLLRERFLEKLN